MKKMRQLLIGCALVLGMASASQAAVTVYVYQDGNDVKVIGSGSINKAGLVMIGSTNLSPSIGEAGFFTTSAPAGQEAAAGYNFVYSGSFMTNGSTSTPPSSTTGSGFGLFRNAVYLPWGYNSSAPINFTQTYNNKTLANMALPLGTYTWTVPNDTVTMRIGVAPTPPAPPATSSVPVMEGWWLVPGVLAGAGMFVRRRKKE